MKPATSRTRPLMLLKGVPLRDVFASECLRDLSKVKGHNSFYDIENGVAPFTGTIGEDVPIITGIALARKLKGSDAVAVCIQGDGGSSRGAVHESMVVAAAWKLPIIFVIEDNQYALGTPKSKTYAIQDLSDRAKGYGFPGVSVDGNDVVEVYEVSKRYIDRARDGGGPALIAAETYRFHGHNIGDAQPYRPKGEAEEWWKLDPLPRYTKALMDIGVLTRKEADKMERELKTEIDEAAAAALALPWPTKENYIKTAVAEL
ncbi:MAG: thiamine pyrophosphate-dependent dehydrogenase E1 component subunit alpha [Dehalococcoidales bacterium]|nr:thiamine pyrophosphate-dependent dehydrogenase E1 component subunit alpha [Dehalococcoidales bacterium]